MDCQIGFTKFFRKPLVVTTILVVVVVGVDGCPQLWKSWNLVENKQITAQDSLDKD
jgi:hypothetical protein